jgi:hypothetical protein
MAKNFKAKFILTEVQRKEYQMAKNFKAKFILCDFFKSKKKHLPQNFADFFPKSCADLRFHRVLQKLLHFHRSLQIFDQFG